MSVNRKVTVPLGSSVTDVNTSARIVRPGGALDQAEPHGRLCCDTAEHRRTRVHQEDRASARFHLEAPSRAPYLLTLRNLHLDRNGKGLIRAFAEPSDGLEPSTPSLPLACLCRFCGDAICERLPPVATTGLHKGSIRVSRSGNMPRGRAQAPL